ncbi:helix-turn-helix domain-containing protein [Methylobacterium sp. D48H]
MTERLPVPSRLAAAFDGRTTLTLQETASALEMDQKTLRREVDRGRIKYVLRGTGEKRKLRRFLLSDLLDYLHDERRSECPSISVPTRRPTGASFGSKVTDIASLRARLSGVPRSSPKSS